MLGQDDGHVLDDLLRDFGDVLFVHLGDEDGADAGSVGRQHFLFEAADGQDPAAKGDFAGHGQAAVDRPLGESGGDGDGQGDAGRGSFLGLGALGQMHVEVELLIEVGVETEVVGAGTDVGHGRLR